MKAKDFIDKLFKSVPFVNPDDILLAKTTSNGDAELYIKTSDSTARKIHLLVTIVDDDYDLKNQYISTVIELKNYFNANNANHQTEVSFDCDEDSVDDIDDIDIIRDGSYIIITCDDMHAAAPTANGKGKIYIDVVSPKYRGAKQPAFDKFSVNEDRFEDELRPKYASIEFDPATNTGSVEWESQEGDYFSDDLEKEIIRAFKANGAKPGAKIEVKYGQRDYGMDNETTLTI